MFAASPARTVIGAPWLAPHGWLVRAALMAGVLMAAALAWAAPLWFAAVLAMAALAVIAAAACLWPAPATVAWLAAVALTPDMWLGISNGPVVAALKLSGLALAAACVVRYGPRADWWNPGAAFAAIFLAGLAHDPPPGLSHIDSLRSLAGSVAPFAFSFSVLSRGWADTVLRAIRWLPLFVAAAGLMLQAAGIHDAIADSGGMRLAGAGHPAFMAGFAMAGAYACLLELMRGGRAGHAALLGVNVAILLLTGARAPIAVTLIVTSLAFAFVPSPAFLARARLGIALAGAACLATAIPIAVVLSLRLVSVVDTDAAFPSGRDMLWPMFSAAWDQRPLLGWGLGAGNAIIPVDGEISHMVGTVIAHNEYLRIGAEGGWLGLLLLCACFVAWTWRNTRALRPSDAGVMALVMAGSAAHAYTDNTLIATTGSVMFAFVSAAFARREPPS